MLPTQKSKPPSPPNKRPTKRDNRAGRARRVLTFPSVPLQRYSLWACIQAMNGFYSRCGNDSTPLAQPPTASHLYFVLSHYVIVGVEELDRSKLTPLAPPQIPRLHRRRRRRPRPSRTNRPSLRRLPKVSLPKSAVKPERGKRPGKSRGASPRMWPSCLTGENAPRRLRFNPGHWLQSTGGVLTV